MIPLCMAHLPGNELQAEKLLLDVTIPGSRRLAYALQRRGSIVPEPGKHGFPAESKFRLSIRLAKPLALLFLLERVTVFVVFFRGARRWPCCCNEKSRGLDEA